MSELDDAQAENQAAIAKLQDGLTKLAADNQKGLSDLEAAIASKGDVTAAVAALKDSAAKITALATAAQDIDASIVAADPGPQPGPTTAP